MSEKSDSWEKRVERVLKLQLEVQRDILKALTGGALESRVTIHPGQPRFYDKTSLPCRYHQHDGQNHHHSNHGHKRND